MALTCLSSNSIIDLKVQNPNRFGNPPNKIKIKIKKNKDKPKLLDEVSNVMELKIRNAFFFFLQIINDDSWTFSIELDLS